MNVPSFVDWAVMLAGLRWDMSNPLLARRERLVNRELTLFNYILSRIERKESQMKALLYEVAVSGVSHDAGKYVEVQIDASTWEELAQYRPRLSDDGFPYPKEER